MNSRQTDQTITALYERLSRDDEFMGDSNSIIGQKQMQEDYAARPGPMAEEPEKLEKDRQRRAYDREKSRRCALRKKQRQEAAAV